MTSWWLASFMPGNSATSQCSCKLRGKGASGCRGGASRRLRPPELLEPLGASAIPFVELVTHRIRVVIILVIVLRRGKGGDRLDFRRYRLALEAIRNLLLRRLGQTLLFIVADEDHASIGVALVAELTVCVEWVDIVPIGVEQLRIGHFCGIVDDLNRLLIAFMVAIVRVRLGAAGIARHRPGHARHLVEGGLDAPETAAGENCSLVLIRSRGLLRATAHRKNREHGDGPNCAYPSPHGHDLQNG